MILCSTHACGHSAISYYVYIDSTMQYSLLAKLLRLGLSVRDATKKIRSNLSKDNRDQALYMFTYFKAGNLGHW